ncbi:hypothetical protein V8E52_008261 [Russula decolorans]
MSLRARIDNAFYSALDPQNRPSHDPVEAPGGFLLDDNPGGFLPPSPPAAGHETGHGRPERDEQFSYIPLSRIPHALQLLDLPPDDEEVLAVFRNAATGWEDDDSSRRTAHRRMRNPTTTSEDNDVTEGRVSLRDWRAVCAAVMGEDRDDEDDREGSSAINGDEILDATGEDSSPEVEESSGGSSDEYRMTETRSRKRSRKSAAATGGDAGTGATRKTRARKTRSATTRRRSPLSPSTSAEITPRQRRECLKAFLLFFPGVPEEEAQRRRLGVREVNDAATVLKEKIKTEEIIEMLEAFSTSPDKTMCLSDFEKLMITTRLA